MSSPTQWSGSDHNMWMPTGTTSKALPPDFYILSAMMGQPYLTAHCPKTDNAIIVADSVSNRIIDQIKRFHDARPVYERFGLLHKRGIMLTGDAGSGKSMAANIAGKYVIEKGGCVISPSNPGYFELLPSMLTQLRKIHPDMPVLCILEDIDHPAYTEHIEMHLSLLDGHWQIGNCFYIATTNHVSEIDERLTNRPKRYDEVINVGPPSEEARRSYLEQIVPKDQPMRKEAIDALVKASHNLMFSHLSELMIAYLVLDHPLDEAAKRLHKMNEPPNDDDIMGGSPASGNWTIAIDASALKKATKVRSRR